MDRGGEGAGGFPEALPGQDLGHAPILRFRAKAAS
jgi:hypothetical protein